MLLHFEESALLGFKLAAPAHLSTSTLTSTDDRVGWWVVMKHFGAPTRLLDWSLSPYVAAYFACSGHSNRDGSIYFFGTQAFEQALAERYAIVLGSTMTVPEEPSDALFERGAPSILLPVHFRYDAPDRALVQRSIFTVCRNVAADQHGILEEMFSGVNPNDWRADFGRLVIPAMHKPDFLRRLRVMNIHGGSLFPGLDGLGRQLDEILRSRPY
jgi:hypothetical protein